MRLGISVYFFYSLTILMITSKTSLFLCFGLNTQKNKHMKFLQQLSSFILLMSTSILFGQELLHPGLLNTKEELDWTKSKIAAGEQPWKKAFDDIKSSVSFNYKNRAMAVLSDQGKSDLWMDDCNKAYDYAMLWYYSEDQRYADEAIKIFNAWTILKEEHNNLNIQWAGGDLYAAAEIILHSNAGWKTADVDKFKQWSRDFILPVLLGRPEWKHNAQQTNIRTLMMVYIFLDDKKGFNDELAEWRHYTPIYISPDGTTNETCRDGHHVNYGVEGTLQSAQVAWNQGVDLFSEQKDRLRNFMHLHSGWYTLDIPIPSDICANDGHKEAGLMPCAGRPGTSRWHNPPCRDDDMLLRDKTHAHLVHRLGMSLPYSSKYNDNIRGVYDRMCLQDYTGNEFIYSNTNNNGNKLPTGSFSKPTVNSFMEGYTLMEVMVEAQDTDGTIASVELQIDDVSIRTETGAPYSWGIENTTTQTETVGLVPGTHILSALITDDKGGVKKVNKTVVITETKAPYIERIAIPGVLEAEHYDKGGEGISYHDIDEINKGAGRVDFRTGQGVDIDNGNGGKVLGWTDQGEWVDYSVGISNTGIYEAELIISSNSGGGQFSLTLDDEEILGTTEVLSTGGWADYQPMIVELDLPEGQHSLKLHIEKKGFNIDKINFKRKSVTFLIDQASGSKIDLFPNPSKNGMFNLSKSLDWEVYSHLGQLISKGNTDKIDLSIHPKGMYVLKTIFGSEKLMIK